MQRLGGGGDEGRTDGGRVAGGGRPAGPCGCSSRSQRARASHGRFRGESPGQLRAKGGVVGSGPLRSDRHWTGARRSPAGACTLTWAGLRRLTPEGNVLQPICTAGWGAGGPLEGKARGEGQSGSQAGGGRLALEGARQHRVGAVFPGWDMSGTRSCEVGGGWVRGRRGSLLNLRSSRRSVVTVAVPGVLCGVGEGWIPEEGREAGLEQGRGGPCGGPLRLPGQ